MAKQFQCGRFRFDLDRPLLMGIVNLTSDSFSGDGLAAAPERALEQALRLVEEGADLVDVGGESSRPGAPVVPLDEELRRVIPLVERLSQAGIAVSVDTMKPEVMRLAIEAGADLINDINAFRADGALAAVAGSPCGLCVMHMQGLPGSMQQNPQYSDVQAEVRKFLEERMRALQHAGVAKERILLDPGFGFGKTLAHNLALFENLPGLGELAPVLVGVSRKSMLGALTGLSVDQRQTPSAVAALAAARLGAAVLRVHDVAATRAALQVWDALAGEPGRLAGTRQ